MTRRYDAVTQEACDAMTTTFYGDRREKASTSVLDLLLRLLSSNWTWGRLTLVLPDGANRQLTGRSPGHSAVLVIRDPRFAARVLKSGDIGFAEGYMAGEWDTPDLAVLLETLVNNYDHIRRLFDGNPLMNAVNWLGHRLNRNSRRGSRRNIHAHYDLGNAFVRRRNIWRRFGVALTESGPRQGLAFRRRACGAASGDVRWSVS